MMAQLKVSGKKTMERPEIGVQAGNRNVAEKGNRVKQGEWNYRQQRAAIEPLQLLALQGGVGERVTADKEAGRKEVEESIVGRADLIQRVLEQSCSLPEVNRIKP
jgi:hypothetical protein